MKNRISAYVIFIAALFCGNLYSDPLRPVPWVTHEAVLFLNDYMAKNPNASILEFGSGSSTVWFSKRTDHLVTIEHNPDWYNRVLSEISTNPECNFVHLILHEQPYYKVCNYFPNESFDLILVDGRNRKGCIVNSIPLLKSGGVLMIDNAERPYYQEALALLQSWQHVKTVQTEPDTCGFMYNNWQTHWYIKP
jgi:predicted O-methyltransferase YrrM